MSTVLADKQFEILPTEDASTGFVFGKGADVSINDEGWDPGQAEWLTQDTENTRRGVKAFGRDVQSARQWVWESHVDKYDEDEAIDTLEAFAAAWSPDELVEQSGAVTALRYSFRGRTRRIFGRPRRFAAPPSNRVMSGYVPITHDFDCVDHLTYDDDESMAMIPFNSEVAEGGWTFPAAFPLITVSAQGIGETQLAVGGNARTYPVIRFNGPWVEPSMSTPDWTVAWMGSLSAGEWVEIDARPWKLTVLNQSGASVVGDLYRRTWLEDIYLKPGTQPQVTLDGFSSSGTASATVRWRNAWKSL